jgi:heme iron utilization protein
MKDFLNNIKTCVIGSLDSSGHPFSSYAPYNYDGCNFYIYISDIATHAKNIQQNAKTSLFFIEDEEKTENLFARKRISLQCDASMISRESEKFETIMQEFAQKFDSKMVEMLKGMMDFNLYIFTVNSGEATFGFGEAYNIGGDNMNELVARKGGGHGHRKS